MILFGLTVSFASFDWLMSVEPEWFSSIYGVYYYSGATVGGLCALSGTPIDDRWTRPWQGRIGTRLAGHSELQLEDVVQRTLKVARAIA